MIQSAYELLSTELPAAGPAKRRRKLQIRTRTWRTRSKASSSSSRNFSRKSMMKLLLPDTVENQLKRELRAAGRREIGGVLLGELVGPGVFRVAEITVQRTGGTSSTFVRIPRLHAEAIQAFFRRTGHRYERFNYLGEWHSHPSYPTRPSASDLRARSGAG